MRERIERCGGSVFLDSDAVRIQRTGDSIDGIVVRRNEDQDLIQGNAFLSSIPLIEFIEKLDPPAPSEILAAARMLKYRDFLVVCLVVGQEHLFSDQWIYVHDPTVRVARIQNFKNWSTDMVPDTSKTCLGLEYFCSKGDDLWNSDDKELIALAKRELDQIGIANSATIEDGRVYRLAKAYPVYDSNYAHAMSILKKFLDGFKNFYPIGRGGLHRYDNQDHAMLTGILAARNLLLQEKNDIWNVNADTYYHEVGLVALGGDPKA